MDERIRAIVEQQHRLRVAQMQQRLADLETSYLQLMATYNDMVARLANLENTVAKLPPR